MGHATEIMLENQQEVFDKNLAKRVGLTYDQLTDIDYEIEENDGRSGVIFGYFIVFDEDGPEEILEKLESSIGGNRLLLDISEFENLSILKVDDLEDAPKTSCYIQAHNTFDDIYKLAKLRVSSPKIKQLLLRQQYSQVFTVVETYLWESLKEIITKTPNLIDRLIKQAGFPGEGLSIEEKQEKAKNIINDTFYSNPDKVTRLFQTILGVKIEFPSDFIGDMKSIRNHFTHRNGKDKNGKFITLNKRDIRNLISLSEKFIDYIERLIYYKLPFKDFS